MILLNRQLALACAAGLLLSSAAATAQQTPVPGAPSPSDGRPAAISVDEAIELTNGWALLGQKMPDQAAARAARVLAAYPRSAAAIVLAVEAEMARAGAAAGLAQYERWLGARAHEEPSIVRRIAVGSLRETAQDPQAAEARIEALRALAAEGDDGAIRSLTGAALDGAAPEMRVLASQGNEAAIAVVIASLESSGANPIAAIAALAASGSATALAPLSKRLDDPSPEIRGAAVEALGKLGPRHDVLERIRPALKDRVSFVRVKAAGALFALGDMAGLELLRALLEDEAAVSRLVAVQAMASRPDVQWLDHVRRLTAATEPEIRVGAAKLLLPHDSEAARKILEAAARDPNPAIRDLAGEAIIELSANDLRALRHLLRSPSALSRTRAAARILSLVR